MMKDDAKTTSPLIGRRAILTTALVGSAATALPAHPASNASQPSSPLTAQTTEGPYYLALDLVRTDITEGFAGIPLDVVFTVLDRAGNPCGGSLVDIWHCDAQGAYSGFEQLDKGSTRSRTFLRGTQPVGADGVARFSSIYPGWYQGRTTHLHFKVKTGSLTNLTSQFFLPDVLSEFLYAQVPAYKRAELRDTLNSTDGIAIEAGSTVQGNVREADGRYVASLTVYVDRTANPAIDRPPVPGGPPPGDRAGRMPPPPSGRLGPPRPKSLQGEERVRALLPTAKRADAMPPPFGPPPKS